MSKAVSPQLPPSLFTRMSATDVPGPPFCAHLLSTVTATGRPHVALLSDAEILATSPTRLWLVTWASSTTSDNLRLRGSHASLSLVHESGFWSVRIRPQQVHQITSGPGEPELTVFAAAVAEVIVDRAPYAEIASGVTFTLTDQSTTQRWIRTRASLLEVVEATQA